MPDEIHLPNRPPWPVVPQGEADVAAQEPGALGEGPDGVILADDEQVDHEQGVLLGAPNLSQATVNLPMAKLLTERFGVPVAGPHEALDDVHLRLDVLWSRLSLFADGRVGDSLRLHDEGYGTIDRLTGYLEEIDPVILDLRPGDAAVVTDILRDLEALQTELRNYTLRVVRAESAAAAMVQERIKFSSIMTPIIALVVVGVCLTAILLILRDNARVDRIREIMGGNEFTLAIDLGLGRGEDRVVTCDLSEEYVRINAKYTT